MEGLATDDEDGRLAMEVGTTCFIFSRSKQNWLIGIITKITIDSNTNQEWLTVRYGGNKSKKIQRFCKDLKVREMPIADKIITKEREFGWKELTVPPFEFSTGTQYSNMCAINVNEIAIASEMIPRKPYGGIYVYSKIADDWIVLKYYPKKLPFLKATKLSLAFNASTSELYLYGVHELCIHSVLAKVNIITLKCTYQVIQSYNAGVGASAFVIGSTFHLIGGAVSDQHVQFDADSNKQIAKYKVWNSTSDENKRLDRNQEHGAVYIDSEKEVWTFGGRANDGISSTFMDSIFVHDLGGTYYHLAPGSAWNKLLVKMPYKMSAFGCCVCYNKYIITFGGKKKKQVYNQRDPYEYISDIYVMNAQEIRANEGRIGKGNKCMLDLPDDAYSYYCMVLPYIHDSDADLIIDGFMRKYVCFDYAGYVPYDIVYCTFDYCQTEYIYLMQRDHLKPKFWSICVDDLLNMMIGNV